MYGAVLTFILVAEIADAEHRKDELRPPDLGKMVDEDTVVELIEEKET